MDWEPLRQAGRVAGCAGLGALTIWTAANHGTPVYVEVPGIRSVWVGSLPIYSEPSVTKDRREYGIIQTSTGMSDATLGVYHAVIVGEGSAST